MKESYRKGVANHPGLESCGGGRKTAIEAFDRGICRLGIELRKGPSTREKPTASQRLEGNKAACVSASASPPCGVRDPMHA